jgi:cathepsin X
MAYSAKNLDLDHKCTNINLCSECLPPMPAKGETSKNCRAVKNFKRYFVVAKYSFFGHFKMMQEIYAHGPISCNICEDLALQHYKKGIFFEKGPRHTKFMSHVVEIVGYGHETEVRNKKGFWIVRNIIGSHWGEDGFFRIRMGRNILGIEQACSAGIPSLNHLEEIAAFLH